MLIELLFSQAAPASPNLLFGADETAPASTVNLVLTAQLPSPRAVSVLLRPSIPINVNAFNLPGLTFTGEARYFSYAQRPIVGQTKHRWQQTSSYKDSITLCHQLATAEPAGWNTEWQYGTILLNSIAHYLPSVLIAAPRQWQINQQQASYLHNETKFIHENATPVTGYKTDTFQNAVYLYNDTCLIHQDCDHSKRISQHIFWQNTKSLVHHHSSDFQKGSFQLINWCVRYQKTMQPPPGTSVLIIPKPPKPSYCYTPNGHLLFTILAPSDTYLLFFCDKSPPKIIPIKRVYIMINNVSLRRASDNLPIPVLNFSLSLDIASWAWGFNARLPASAENLIIPNNNGPVKLIATVNDTEFKILVEDINRERIFCDSSISVSGRGHNAVLAAPYAPILNFQQPNGRTARQLMDDVLTLNGVSLGWNIDWNLTDWYVPANVFTYQGTWMEALIFIANAAGGYLIPHPSIKTIYVKHRYPVPPWEWNSVTPDIELPADIVVRESIRWIKKPDYNRVFVSGQEVGVLGQVTRDGTAGDILAPMVVDPLITDVIAARQRGISILSDTGRQLEVSLRLPVLDRIGIIEPGTFIRYTDGSTAHLGLVRSTQIEAGIPEVWQTIGVESRYDM